MLGYAKQCSYILYLVSTVRRMRVCYVGIGALALSPAHASSHQAACGLGEVSLRARSLHAAGQFPVQFLLAVEGLTDPCGLGRCVCRHAQAVHHRGDSLHLDPSETSSIHIKCIHYFISPTSCARCNPIRKRRIV